jgi:hypothetical protein
LTKTHTVTDRIAAGDGAACPRCGQVMHRFRRPAGYKPLNSTPFHLVLVWDRCAACNFICRLEEHQ